MPRAFRKPTLPARHFYLASNALPHNAKIKTFIRDMEPVMELGPDALIMADPGLILMVRERWPDMPIHLSVQANTMNYASVRFWQQQGIARIILSRELSLDQIEEIRQECPDMELEVFVHGALCIAYSGRCLLSGLFQSPRCQPGHLHQFLPLGLQGQGCHVDISGDIQRRQPPHSPQSRCTCWKKAGARANTCRSRKMNTAPTS